MAGALNPTGNWTASKLERTSATSTTTTTTTTTTSLKGVCDREDKFSARLAQFGLACKSFVCMISAGQLVMFQCCCCCCYCCCNCCCRRRRRCTVGLVAGQLDLPCRQSILLLLLLSRLAILVATSAGSLVARFRFRSGSSRDQSKLARIFNGLLGRQIKSSQSRRPLSSLSLFSINKQR